jgi:hypothetical protein
LLRSSDRIVSPRRMARPTIASVLATIIFDIGNDVCYITAARGPIVLPQNRIPYYADQLLRLSGRIVLPRRAGTLCCLRIVSRIIGSITAPIWQDSTTAARGPIVLPQNRIPYYADQLLRLSGRIVLIYS